MIEVLLPSLGTVLAWPTFGWLLLGMVIGLVVGVLPGLGSVFSITVLLPVALALEPLHGLTFLVALFTVGQISAEITSILFAVPGEPSAAATILDGYPMTKQGNAGLALGINLTSNLVGGLFGALILLLFIPVARPLVLSLGSPELFMCIVVGIAFVCTLTGERALVGYMVAALGFVLSMVGTSVITGAPRYTFGVVQLWAGLPMVSFALGFFAVPELYQLYKTGVTGHGALGRVGTDIRNAVKETFRHWKTVIACSGLGVFIGAVPGLGASVAQWISYAFAKKLSHEPEKFGHGAIGGLIGPSAACNAKDGGQLIPTLFFGVPGGVSMALLLLAMLSMDVTPGPRMLTDHFDITMAIVWIIVITHILGVVITAVNVRSIVRISATPRHILFPILLALVIIAAYATTNSLIGILVLVIASAMGIFMKAMSWARPPFVLSFILAPLAERYLFLSYQNHGWGVVTRPGVLILAVVLVAQIIWVLRE